MAIHFANFLSLLGLTYSICKFRLCIHIQTQINKGQAPKTPFLREEYKLNKDKNLNIRISTKDLDYIKQRSKKANLTITGYVTKCALNKKIYVYDGYKEFLTELRKIGTNINQIAKACNSGEISNPNLVVFQRELKNIWQSLKSKPPKEI